MTNDDRAWTPKAVWVNTIATVVGSVCSVAAVVIAIIAILKASS